MASIRTRSDGRLFFDFRVNGIRCRELTTLKDTEANRRKMHKVLRRIEDELAIGTFDYARYFPGSQMARRFAAEKATAVAAEMLAMSDAERRAQDLRERVPLFKDFVETWKAEKQIEWRRAYRDTVDGILQSRLLPAFGEMNIADIDRASVLSFRSEMAQTRYRNRRWDPSDEGKLLAPATINRTVGLLRTILEEAALRFGIDNPCRTIKRLKNPKSEISPFTLDEVNRILASVRADYRPYLIFRFFTGVRSGEAHGLRWKHVDFARREVLIRETWQNNRVEDTKTTGSRREIMMSQPVFDALRAMRPEGYEENPAAFADCYVFHTRRGKPIDNCNFNDRVWKPLLRYLGLDYRRPYQMRHTCATLWLAAGESPEWIARQLGHTSTEMLFRTYSRYVPNLMRKDGKAFDSLVSGFVNGGVAANDAAILRRASGGQRND